MPSKEREGRMARTQETVTLWRTKNEEPHVWHYFDPDSAQEVAAGFRAQPKVFEVRDFVPAEELGREQDKTRDATDSRDGWQRRYRVELRERRRLVGELNLTNSALTSARARATQLESRLEAAKDWARRMATEDDGLPGDSMQELLSLLDREGTDG